VQTRRLAGAIAIVTFAGAVVGLEPWVDSNLPLHMTEHLLLMVVVAPLAVIAWPHPPLPAFARTSAFAALAVAAETVALVVWHLPGPFQAAEAHAPLHAFEHATFLATSIAVWWVVVAAPLSIGVRFGTLVASSAPMLLLGVLMTLAPAPWYHGASLVDQQVAGALMWGPGSLPAVIAAAWLVASVVREDERGWFAAAATRGDGPT
jgi:cytochrome c oxidase assembly factor CtaG